MFFLPSIYLAVSYRSLDPENPGEVARLWESPVRAGYNVEYFGEEAKDLERKVKPV